MFAKRMASRNPERGRLGLIAGFDGSFPAMNRRAWIGALALAAGAGCSQGAVVHVNIAAPPGGNGVTWASAFNALDVGLAAAQTGDQVWVATGTYVTPSPSAPPWVSSFLAPAGVSLYGGFAGTESDVSQANPAVNITILKGKIQDPAGGGPVLVLRNSSATLNGFTIRDGFAPNNGSSLRGGGGILIDGGAVTVSTCIFTNNSTYYNPGQDYGRGGAICVFDGATVVVDGCAFSANYTHGGWEWDFLTFPHRPLPGHGGAIYVEGGKLTVQNSTFTNNRGGDTYPQCAAGASLAPGDAASGGAIYAIDSDLTVSRSTFSGNSAGSSSGPTCGDPDPVYPNAALGGAAGEGGAIYVSGGTAGVSRCVFVSNSAGQSDAGSGSGGAIFTAGPAYFANCRFLGNRAGEGLESGNAGDGGGVYANSQVFLVNCEFTGNAAGVGSSTVAPPGLDGIGGAIYAAGSNRIDNCTIAKNSSRGEAAGTYGANLANSIVYFNESTLLGQSLDAQVIGGSALYSTVQGWIPSLYDPVYRNSNVDPKFAALLGPDGIPGTFDDNARLTEGSLAIDSANSTRLYSDLNANNISEFLNYDLDDNPRIVDDPIVSNTSFGPPLDRGAYEFGRACTGDLNGDGQVDDADFVHFAAAYNLLDCADPAMPLGCPADLNKDGVVDDADFVQFVAAYDALVCP